MRSTKRFPTWLLIISLFTLGLAFVGVGLRMYRPLSKPIQPSVSYETVNEQVERCYLNNTHEFLNPQLSSKKIAQIDQQYQQLLASKQKLSPKKRTHLQKKWLDITNRYQLETAINQLFDPQEKTTVGQKPIQKAISGQFSYAKLVVKSTVTPKKLTTIKQQFTQYPTPKKWTKQVTACLHNAENQVARYETATKKVTALYHGDKPRTNLTATELQTAYSTIGFVQNKDWQADLQKKWRAANEVYTATTAEEIIPFEQMSDRSQIIVTARQTRQEWWKGPLSFQVDIHNHSDTHVSFNYHHFMLEKANHELTPSIYGKTADDRLIVEKGTSAKPLTIAFSLADEEMVQTHQGSEFVYLLGTDPQQTYGLAALTIQGKLQKFRPKDVTDDQLRYARTALTAAGIDPTQLTEDQLRNFVSDMVIHSATIQHVIKLACQTLQLDFPTAQQKFLANMPT